VSRVVWKYAPCGLIDVSDTYCEWCVQAAEAKRQIVEIDAFIQPRIERAHRAYTYGLPRVDFKQHERVKRAWRQMRADMVKDVLAAFAPQSRPCALGYRLVEVP
jgi:hypothetical protein